MTRHKVCELDGALLDAAVAAAEGRRFELRPDSLFPSSGPLACYPVYTRAEGSWTEDRDHGPLAYSTSWALGGPIISRERIRLQPETKAEHGNDGWRATITGSAPFTRIGSTPLIAAMRAYVARKFGETVELP